MFSKACVYAIKASIFITLKSAHDQRVTLNDISAAIDSPGSFTAKILQILSRENIINSLKGPTGGFSVTNSKAKKIRLKQIVKSIDGERVYNGCGLGFNHCNDLRPCPMHHRYKPIREDLRQMLENTTLYELSNDINKQLTFLKN